MVRKPKVCNLELASERPVVTWVVRLYLLVILVLHCGQVPGHLVQVDRSLR